MPRPKTHKGLGKKNDINVTCAGYGEILTTSLEPSPTWKMICVGKKDSY